ncbi:tryptophan synthase subunit alpha [Peptococcaceae bacterium SCADC1_2_3]|nr:tryptophan synthase subunit alpha [Peptococcaceae bacterium SCADC1_2_3]KFI36662.1 tryptophan synthase subunit alpha [Peptococcaceae bacterium SCADC1_2_3]KFI37521.1 tryptophan synthase subunit alpha [Peptococcaceae bacterium SCADC1_2_3]
MTKRFKDLTARQEKGLITYLTAGYPDLNTTIKLVEVMAGHGADFIELGIPFSDPIADGPVIQQAANFALQKGIKTAEIIAAVRKIRQRLSTSVPLIFMTYYNPILQYGLRRFVAHSVEAGIDGLIVPDLSFEESEELRTVADAYNLALIPLVAPTTPLERLTAFKANARGFVYCVSVTGVTGVRNEITTDLASFTDRVRQCINLPVAIGFGIAGPYQAAQVAPFCEAVIVGSAVVNLIAKNNDFKGMSLAIGSLAQDIKSALLNYKKQVAEHKKLC